PRWRPRSARARRRIPRTRGAGVGRRRGRRAAPTPSRAGRAAAPSGAAPRCRARASTRRRRRARPRPAAARTSRAGTGVRGGRGSCRARGRPRASARRARSPTNGALRPRRPAPAAPRRGGTRGVPSACTTYPPQKRARGVLRAGDRVARRERPLAGDARDRQRARRVAERCDRRVWIEDEPPPPRRQALLLDETREQRVVAVPTLESGSEDDVVLGRRLVEDAEPALLLRLLERPVPVRARRVRGKRELAQRRRAPFVGRGV